MKHLLTALALLGLVLTPAFAKTPDQLHGVPEGAVALLKGRRHPSHAGTILHRSPSITAARNWPR